MVQRHEAAMQLFIAHEQLAETIEPAVAHLNDPAPCFLLRVTTFRIRFALAIHDMWNVAVKPDGQQRGLSTIPGIGAQMRAAAILGKLALHHLRSKHRTQLADIMRVGSGHDDRQGDATRVHQQVAFAAFFSPDPSGCCRPILGPAAP